MMDFKHGFAVVVVLYNPDESSISNLNQFNDFGLYVVNNGESDIKEKLSQLAKTKQFHYFHNENKGGIAGAFNVGLNQAFSDGYDHVFTFDQDSKIPENFYSSMDALIKAKKADLVCPDFFDVNSKTHAAFVHLTKFSYKVVEKTEYTNLAISSGLGISRIAWKDIGEFRESYIIDHVDTDYCLRALDRGYKIFVNYDVCLNHAIGNREKRYFLGVTLKPNHHNYIRKYYISRNGTHLSFEYFFKYPAYFYLNVLRVIHELVCVLFYEDHKIKKTTSILKGILHSITGRLGVYA